jgi:hypothetical protein
MNLHYKFVEKYPLCEEIIYLNHIFSHFFMFYVIFYDIN